MDKRSIELLGFHRVLQIIGDFAQTAGGAERIEALAPASDRSELEARFLLIEEARRYLDEAARPQLGHLEDPRPLFEQIRVVGNRLQPVEFLELLGLLKTARHLKAKFEPEHWSQLSRLTSGPSSPDGAIADLEKTFDSSGEVRDGAHPGLAKARRRHGRSRERIQEKLSRLLSGPKSDSFIQDPFITTRNDRFVIPVKVERQREVPGVVHSASSSGATVFLEPLSAVDLNNEYLTNKAREEELFRQLLTALTDRLRDNIEQLEAWADSIDRIDALFAICSYSKHHRCVTPDFSQDLSLVLDEARHPLLIESLGDGEVVPTTIRFEREKRGIIISGPNTGGKTVALKTVGLLAIMAQSGLTVPATRALFPLFNDVLADIGDHQSIAEQLSTFSGHILRIREMLSRIDSPSLVLIDEIGAGTDATYGAALGIALIDEFLRCGTLLIATTHHQSVKLFASSREDLENASVELDQETLEPTFRIQQGLSGGSSGLEIALRLGLPSEIVESARSRLDDTDRQAEKYLEHLRRESTALDRERGDLRRRAEALKQEMVAASEIRAEERKRSREEIDANLEKWSLEFRRQSERILKSVKDRFEAARLRRDLKIKQEALRESFRRQIKKQPQSEGSAPHAGSSTGTLKVGAWARHRTLDKLGVLRSLGTNEATLEISGKRLACRPEDLEAATEAPEPGVRLPKNVRLNAVEQTEPEINLVGKTVDEALPRVDKYLDRASLANRAEVRLIHGFGTGRLRQAIAEFLDGHPHVSSYRREGGATIVALR